MVIIFTFSLLEFSPQFSYLQVHFIHFFFLTLDSLSLSGELSLYGLSHSLVGLEIKAEKIYILGIILEYSVRFHVMLTFHYNPSYNTVCPTNHEPTLSLIQLFARIKYYVKIMLIEGVLYSLIWNVYDLVTLVRLTSISCLSLSILFKLWALLEFLLAFSVLACKRK